MLSSALKAVLLATTSGLDLNFAGGAYRMNGVRGSSPSDLPGWTFSRTGAGTALDLADNVVNFATGVPRITNRGILIEEARTNLLLNSATLSTQNVTVTAVAHSLSFWGTGTITLSGVSTAGPLVGTGANNRVTLTFTPTAGTLTLTVSGSVTLAQLEAGAFPTSYIPTTGAAATRARDIVSVSPPPGLTYPLTLFAEIERTVDTGAAEGYLAAALDGSNFGEIFITTGDKANCSTTGGGSKSSVASVPVGAVSKIAGRCATNNVNVALNGTAASPDTSATMPTAPISIQFGVEIGTGAGSQPNGYTRRATVYPTAYSDAQLAALTA